MKQLNYSYKNRRTDNKMLSSFNKKPTKSKETGVYAIVCEEIKAAYIGQSINLIGRIKNHKSNLVNNKHPIVDLQRDFNIYKDSFEFTVICNSEDDTDLLELETKNIAEYQRNGYRLYNTVLDTTDPFLIVCCQTKEFQKILYRIHEALKSGKIKTSELEYNLDLLDYR
jgi:hypothetical protein